jgi:hypothetical protein
MDDGVDTIEVEELKPQNKLINPDDRRFGKTDEQKMKEWMDEMNRRKDEALKK